MMTPLHFPRWSHTPMRSFRFHATRPSLLVALLCALAAPRGAAQVTLTTDTSYSSDTTNTDGDLVITNGATVSVSGSATLVAGPSGSDYANVFLGDSSAIGNGSLALTSSGSVYSQNAYVGNNAGAGTLTVDGSGALWVSMGGLIIGQSGSGNATVANGGVVSMGSGSGLTAPAAGAGTGSVTIGTFGTLNIGAVSTDDAAAAGIINGNVDQAAPDSVGTLQFNTTGTSGTPTYFTKNGTSTGTGVNVANVALVHTAGYTVFTGTLTPGSTTINGGTVQIGNGGTTGSITGDIAIADNAALAFNRSDTIAYAGAISGAGSVKKSGAGTLTLSGSNTYTGTTTLSAGTLSLGSAEALGSSGTLSFGGGTLQFSAANTTDYSARFSTSANQQFRFDTNGQSVTLATALTSSGGTLTKSGNGILTLTAASTYSGTTTVNAGTLRLAGAGALPSTTALTVYGGATFDLNDISTTIGSLANGGSVRLGSATLTTGGANTNTGLAGVISGTGGLIKTGSGTFGLAGDNTYTGTTTISAGTLRIGSSGNAVGSVAGDIVNNSTLAFDRTGTLIYAGIISGTGGLTTSNVKLVLTGANTYTGSTTINTGTLQIGNGGTTGSVVGNIINRGSLTFNRSDAFEFAGNISNSGSINITGSGAVTLSGANTFTGSVRLTGGTLVLGSAGALGVSGPVTFVNGTLQFSAANTTDYSARFSTGSNQHFSFDTGGQSVTFATRLAGTNATLTKTGSGTLTLSAANTYTGATTVNGGTLRVDGSLAAGSAVSVNSGGTLGGSGTINGTLAINSGGILAPGHSPGTLTAGTTTWNSGGTYQWEINDATGVAGTNWDLLNVTGALNLAATSESPFTLALNSLTSGNATGETGNFDDTTDYSFTFLTTGTGITGFSADKFQLDTSGFQNPFSGSWSVAQDGNALVLNYTAAGGGAIPEPSTYAALMGAAMLAFAWRRKRRPTQTA